MLIGDDDNGDHYGELCVAAFQIMVMIMMIMAISVDDHFHEDEDEDDCDGDCDGEGGDGGANVNITIMNCTRSHLVPRHTLQPLDVGDDDGNDEVHLCVFLLLLYFVYYCHTNLHLQDIINHVAGLLDMITMFMAWPCFCDEKKQTKFDLADHGDGAEDNEENEQEHREVARVPIAEQGTVNRMMMSLMSIMRLMMLLLSIMRLMMVN